MSKITLKIEEEQEDALSELVLALEKSLGCRVAFMQCSIYEVESEDPRAITILETVFGQNKPAPAGKKVAEKGLKAGKKEKKGRIIPYHPRVDERYEILRCSDLSLTGTKLTGGGLALKLKAGKIPAGTSLRHPSKGNFMVEDVNDKLQLAPVVEGSNVVWEARS